MQLFRLVYPSALLCILCWLLLLQGEIYSLHSLWLHHHQQTHVDWWDCGMIFFFVLFCFVLLAALLLWACTCLLINIYPVLKKKKKGTFKKFIWSVVGQWQNNWLWIYNSSHRSLVKNGDDKWAFSTVWRLSLPLDLFLSQTLWPTCLHCSWWFEKLQVHKVSQPCQISQSLLWISYK